MLYSRHLCGHAYLSGAYAEQNENKARVWPARFFLCVRALVRSVCARCVAPRSSTSYKYNETIETIETNENTLVW